MTKGLILTSPSGRRRRRAWGEGGPRGARGGGCWGEGRNQFLCGRHRGGRDEGLGSGLSLRRPSLSPPSGDFPSRLPFSLPLFSLTDYWELLCLVFLMVRINSRGFIQFFSSGYLSSCAFSLSVILFWSIFSWAGHRRFPCLRSLMKGRSSRIFYPGFLSQFFHLIFIVNCLYTSLSLNSAITAV